MKAKKLKEILATVDDDAEIVTSGYDHSYNRVTVADSCDALHDKKSNTLHEYYDGDEEPGCHVITVFLIN